MAWDYFRDNQRIGEVRILDRLSGGDRKDDVRYSVACCACGRHSELTHRQIETRIRKNVRSCRICFAAKAEPVAAETAEAAETDYAEPEGVRDLRGHLWPRLKGPMGPRWGIGNGTNQVIGRGREAYT